MMIKNTNASADEATSTPGKADMCSFNLSRWESRQNIKGCILHSAPSSLLRSSVALSPTNHLTDRTEAFVYKRYRVMVASVNTFLWIKDIMPTATPLYYRSRLKYIASCAREADVYRGTSSGSGLNRGPSSHSNHLRRAAYRESPCGRAYKTNGKTPTNPFAAARALQWGNSLQAR